MLVVCFVSNKGKVSLELDQTTQPELIDIQCFSYPDGQKTIVQNLLRYSDSDFSYGQNHGIYVIKCRCS